MPDKKLLILIISLGLIAVLIGGGFILYLKYFKIVPPPPSVPKPFIAPEGVIDPEIFLAKFEDCLAGKEDPPLNPEAHWPDVIYLLAKTLSQRSEEACLKLKEEEGKDDCLKYFYLTEVVQGQKINCQKFKDIDEQAMCSALINNDSSYCQKIKTPFFKEICLAFILGVDHCNRLTGSYDVSGFAVELESYGIEGKKIIREKGELPEQEVRVLCRKSFYFLQALKERNPEACEAEELKTESFSQIICRILAIPDPQKEWQDLHQKICYEKLGPTIALLKNDSSICEKIPFKAAYNQDLYHSCLSQLK